MSNKFKLQNKDLIYEDIESTKQKIIELNLSTDDILNFLSVYMLIIRSYELNDLSDEIIDFYYQTKSLNKLLN